jgi:hypothetical protein
MTCSTAEFLSNFNKNLQNSVSKRLYRFQWLFRHPSSSFGKHFSLPSSPTERKSMCSTIEPWTGDITFVIPGMHSVIGPLTMNPISKHSRCDHSAKRQTEYSSFCYRSSRRVHLYVRVFSSVLLVIGSISYSIPVGSRIRRCDSSESGAGGISSDGTRDLRTFLACSHSTFR